MLRIGASQKADFVLVSMSFGRSVEENPKEMHVPGPKYGSFYRTSGVFVQRSPQVSLTWRGHVYRLSCSLPGNISWEAFGDCLGMSRSR